MILIPFLLALLTTEVPISQPNLAPWPLGDRPVVAASGDRALVAWRDQRSVAGARAARVDAAGTVLDPAGIPIANGATAVAVAPAGGGDFLVATNTDCNKTVLVRISRDGSSGPPKTIATWADCTTTLLMTTNGDTFLVVIDGARALLIDGNGNVVAGPFVLALSPRPAAVATNGRDYLIAASNNTAVTATPLSHDGELGTTKSVMAGPWNALALSSDGNRYVLAAAGGTLLFQPLAIDGSAFGAPSSAPLTAVVTTLRALWDGTSHIVFWNASGFGGGETLVFARRVDAAGHSAPAVAVTNGADVDVTSLLGNILLVRRGLSGLLGTLAHGTDLTALPADFSITSAAPPQRSPQMVATPGGAVELWDEGLASASARAETLDASGRPTGNIVTIAGAANARIAFDGTSVVVAWVGAGLTLHVQRRSPALDLQDEVRVNGPSSPWTLAAGGGSALVAWQDHAVVFHDGTSSEVALPEEAYVPAAASNDSEFLLAYAQLQGPWPTQGAFPNPPADIRVLRIGRDGTLLAPPQTVAHLTTFVDAMDAASNGDDFLVAWRPDTFGRPDAKSIVASVHVAADGSANGIPQDLSPPNVIEGPMMTAHGNGYAVAWVAQTNGDRVLQWRSANSAAIETLPTPLALTNGTSAAIVAIGPRLVLAYARVDEPAGGVARLFLRAAAPQRVRVAGR